MDVLARSLIVAVAAALVTATAGTVAPAAQDASAPDLTAVYLVNFVRFTTWPAEVLPDGAPVVVCVVGNDWVADSLERLTHKQVINNRTLSIRRTSLEAALGACHVVYGANLHGDRAERLIQTTARLPILTVSDATNFAARGGVANFFFDDGRMRFSVNPDAAARARLRISSKLLSLARIVGS